MNFNTTSSTSSMNTTFATSYVLDETKQCASLTYEGTPTKFFVDFADLNRLLQSKKRFKFYPEEHSIYPSHYNINAVRVDLLTFIHHMDSPNRAANLMCTFLNGNEADLRKENVVIHHQKHAYMMSNYNVLEYFHGHYSNMGHDAFIIKNPRWIVQEKETGITKMFMYCEPDCLVEICAEGYERIQRFEESKNDGKKITFHLMTNGYIMSPLRLYIHQIITGCYGNGGGTMNLSVDHIDRNPLNNTLANLRIATRKEQEQNTVGIMDGTKRKRQCVARALPDDFTQDQMRKYVVYYKECYDAEKDLHREFFKVECHPKLPANRPWISSKSGKITLQEKLAKANKVVDDLANNIYPTVVEKIFPPYVRIEMKKDKEYLTYDHKHTNDVRYNLRLTLKEGYDAETEVTNLFKKLREKYTDKDIQVKLFNSY